MDELERKIEQARKNAQDFVYNTQKKYDQSTVGKFQADASLLTRTFYRISQTCIWAYNKVISPVISWLIKKPIKKLFWMHINLWNRFAYKKDKYQTRQFSKIRSFAVITSMAIFYWYVAPFILEAGYDALWFAATAKHHVVYLNDAPPRGGFDHEFLTKGCDNHPGCSPDDATSYVIRSSPFNDLYRLVMHGELYYPDYVAATIPSVPSECHALTYGIRQKFLVKNAQVFADLLDVRCPKITIKEQ